MPCRGRPRLLFCSRLCTYLPDSFCFGLCMLNTLVYVAGGIPLAGGQGARRPGVRGARRGESHVGTYFHVGYILSRTWKHAVTCMGARSAPREKKLAMSFVVGIVCMYLGDGGVFYSLLDMHECSLSPTEIPLTTSFVVIMMYISV